MGSAVKREVLSKHDSLSLGLVHITFIHFSCFVSVSLGPLRPYMPTSCFIYSSLHVSCNPSSYLWPSIPILIFLYKVAYIAVCILRSDNQPSQAYAYPFT